MKDKLKKCASLFLVLVLFLTLAGCSAPAQEAQEPNASETQTQQDSEGEPAENAERPTISVAVLDFGNFPSDRGTLEDNDLTEWINANSPVAIDFVAITRDEAVTKYSTMLAAGTAPDVIM